LPQLEPARGHLGRQLKCLRLVSEGLGDEVPFVATVFSPLAQARHLAGEERLLEHLHREPEAVLAGLEAICRTTVAYVEAVRGVGIAGIYYAVQHASYLLFDREAYRRFGEGFDRRVLEAARGLWLNVLHLHGARIMFDLAESYPVAVVNWHDRETAPGLAEGRRRMTAAACGGLSREALVLGDPTRVQREARETLRSAHRKGVVLGTGCVVPIIVPRGNLMAARRAVEVAHSQ
jgi:uroporphyrinogen decarboxylase